MESKVVVVMKNHSIQVCWSIWNRQPKPRRGIGRRNRQANIQWVSYAKPEYFVWTLQYHWFHFEFFRGHLWSTFSSTKEKRARKKTIRAKGSGSENMVWLKSSCAFRWLKIAINDTCHRSHFWQKIKDLPKVFLKSPPWCHGNLLVKHTRSCSRKIFYKTFPG